MNGRWINNSWITENDIMENLTAERNDLLNKIRFVESKIEALRHEQYLQFKEYLK